MQIGIICLFAFKKIILRRKNEKIEESSSDGNVVVYEGKNNSGTEVVKGVFQDDTSIKWDADVTLGSSGENNNLGESASNGTSGNINLEELATLKLGIE